MHVYVITTVIVMIGSSESAAAAESEAAGGLVGGGGSADRAALGRRAGHDRAAAVHSVRRAGARTGTVAARAGRDAPGQHHPGARGTAQPGKRGPGGDPAGPQRPGGAA